MVKSLGKNRTPSILPDAQNVLCASSGLFGKHIWETRSPLLVLEEAYSMNTVSYTSILRRVEVEFELGGT